VLIAGDLRPRLGSRCARALTDFAVTVADPDSAAAQRFRGLGDRGGQEAHVEALGVWAAVSRVSQEIQRT